MAKLVLHLPDGSMREIMLDRDRITIGRRSDNDLCLPYPAVSADHAEIITVVADSFLHDRGSTNGTLVNGNRVAKHFLRNHDRIDIGRLQLVYLTNEAEEVEPLPAEEEPHAPVVVAPAPRDSPRNEADPHSRSRERRPTPVDELLTDLMLAQGAASVAIDLPPPVSVVPAARSEPVANHSTSDDAFVEVMNGPNAGQITPMNKREFILGKSGVTLAAIRRDEAGFRLVPVDEHVAAVVNGQPVPREGTSLAYGDLIDVAGVKLRFGRRG